VPFDLPREGVRVRIGEPGDGSYVMVDRLRASQPGEEVSSPLKLDVEGAEGAAARRRHQAGSWRVLLFEQIALEVHFLYRFEEPLFNAYLEVASAEVRVSNAL